MKRSLFSIISFIFLASIIIPNRALCMQMRAPQLNFAHTKKINEQLPDFTHVVAIEKNIYNAAGEIITQQQEQCLMLTQLAAYKELLLSQQEQLAMIMPHAQARGINVVELITTVLSHLEHMIMNYAPYPLFSYSHGHLGATTPLSWCMHHLQSCPSPTLRVEIILHHVDALLAAHPDISQPLTHCAFAEGGLLQSYLLAQALKYVGYQQVQFIIIGNEITLATEEAFKRLTECPTTVYHHAADFEEHCEQNPSSSQRCHSYDIIDPGAGNPSLYRLCFHKRFVNETKAVENPIIFSLITNWWGIQRHYLTAQE